MRRWSSRSCAARSCAGRVEPGAALATGERVRVIRILRFSRRRRRRCAGSRRARAPPIVVLDLRGNPGGLISRRSAVVHVFAARAHRREDAGLHKPAHRFEADDTAVGKLPLVVVVDRGTASAAEIVAAALRDNARHDRSARARSARPRSRRSSRSPAAAASSSRWPGSRSRRRAGVDGRGIRPDIAVTARPGTADSRPARCRSSRCATLDAAPAGGAVVCEVSPRARFVVAQPFFDEGQQLASAGARGGRRRGRRAGGGRGTGPGQGPSSSGWARPRRVRRAARPAIEARRRRAVARSDVLREAAALPGEPRRTAGERTDLLELVTLTIDPPDARDFDDAIASADGDAACSSTSPTSRATWPGRRARRRGGAAGDVGVRAGARRADAARALSSDVCSLRPAATGSRSPSRWARPGRSAPPAASCAATTG